MSKLQGEDEICLLMTRTETLALCEFVNDHPCCYPEEFDVDTLLEACGLSLPKRTVDPRPPLIGPPDPRLP